MVQNSIIFIYFKLSVELLIFFFPVLELIKHEIIRKRID